MRSGLILFAALLAAGTLSVHALPSRIVMLSSPTRMFTLNNTSYSVEKTGRESLIIRKELLGWGIDPSRLPRDGMEPADRSVDILKEAPPIRRSRPMSVPFSFLADHSMQLDTGDAFVDIAGGVIQAKDRSASEKLKAAGWKIVKAEDAGRGICMAIRTEGKETSVGILEEKEGRGLFIRRSEK